MSIIFSWILVGASSLLWTSFSIDFDLARRSRKLSILGGFKENPPSSKERGNSAEIDFDYAVVILDVK